MLPVFCLFRFSVSNDAWWARQNKINRQICTAIPFFSWPWHLRRSIKKNTWPGESNKSFTAFLFAWHRVWIRRFLKFVRVQACGLISGTPLPKRYCIYCGRRTPEIPQQKYCEQFWQHNSRFIILFWLLIYLDKSHQKRWTMIFRIKLMLLDCNLGSFYLHSHRVYLLCLPDCLMANHPHYRLCVHLLSSCISFAMRLIILNNLEQQPMLRSPRHLLCSCSSESWLRRMMSQVVSGRTRFMPFWINLTSGIIPVESISFLRRVCCGCRE